MKRRWKWSATAFAVVLVALLCWWGLKPRVRIVNLSRKPLSQLRLRGRGFDASISDIPPDASTCVVIEPTGDSGLELDFRSNGEDHRSGDIGYLEPDFGNRINIVIKPDLSIQATGDVFVLWPWLSNR